MIPSREAGFKIWYGDAGPNSSFMIPAGYVAGIRCCENGAPGIGVYLLQLPKHNEAAVYYKDVPEALLLDGKGDDAKDAKFILENMLPKLEAAGVETPR